MTLPQEKSLKRREKMAQVCLFGMFLAYVILFFSWCALKFHYFVYNDFDLAIHDQIIWNILHGRIFNSILGIDFLGNHVHFISFLIAPFYWVIPHPLFLLFLQTAFLAAGIFPLYRLARVYLDLQVSLIICLIYLLFPGLGFTNLYEFHPTAFAVFFLLSAAYYFFVENFSMFSVFMLLSVLCQENISLIFFMWGVYALFLKRKLKWVVWPAGLGFFYFLLCVYIILPTFNKNILDFFNIYAPLGNSLGAVAKTCVLHPVRVLSILLEPNKIHYLIQLFDSVTFIPLFAPLTLLPVFLIFLQHLLSVRLQEVSLHFHYTAELIPFIFIGVIFGIKKIFELGPKFKYLIYIFLFNALAVNFAIGPHFHMIREGKSYFSNFRSLRNEILLKQIPPDAAVVTTFKYLSHLSHHYQLYSFHYVYSGFYTLSRKLFHLPDQVQYALIDFNDFLMVSQFYRLDNYRNINAFLKQGSWGTMDVQNTVVLFKKGIPNRYPLYNFVDDRKLPSNSADWLIDQSIKMYGYGLSLRLDRMEVIFYWKLLRHEFKDINLFIDFIDKNGRLLGRQYRPLCYRIWPTQAWQKNQLIEEHQYISIPPKFKGRLKSLMIGFFDFKTGKLFSTNSKDALGRFRIDVPEVSKGAYVR
ncbi:MAG: DUF2079 domain-containing protein [Candidatus Omnitrophica bacterium]|nr:DUF2079 domain-containing protein [Candidatus Omnitrophota bacterium]